MQTVYEFLNSKIKEKQVTLIKMSSRVFSVFHNEVQLTHVSNVKFHTNIVDDICEAEIGGIKITPLKSDEPLLIVRTSDSEITYTITENGIDFNALTLFVDHEYMLKSIETEVLRLSVDEGFITKNYDISDSLFDKLGIEKTTSNGEQITLFPSTGRELINFIGENHTRCYMFDDDNKLVKYQPFSTDSIPKLDPKRSTGRTFRTCLKALERASLESNSKLAAVTVVVGSSDEINTIAKTLHLWLNEYGISVEILHHRLFLQIPSECAKHVTIDVKGFNNINIVNSYSMLQQLTVKANVSTIIYDHTVRSSDIEHIGQLYKSKRHIVVR